MDDDIAKDTVDSVQNNNRQEPPAMPISNLPDMNHSTVEASNTKLSLENQVLVQPWYSKDPLQLVHFSNAVNGSPVGNENEITNDSYDNKNYLKNKMTSHTVHTSNEAPASSIEGTAFSIGHWNSKTLDFPVPTPQFKPSGATSATLPSSSKNSYRNSMQPSMTSSAINRNRQTTLNPGDMLSAATRPGSSHLTHYRDHRPLDTVFNSQYRPQSHQTDENQRARPRSLHNLIGPDTTDLICDLDTEDDSAMWTPSSSFCEDDTRGSVSSWLGSKVRDHLVVTPSNSSNIYLNDSSGSNNELAPIMRSDSTCSSVADGGSRRLSRKNSTCSSVASNRDDAFVEEFCARRGSGVCSGNAAAILPDELEPRQHGKEAVVLRRTHSRASGREMFIEKRTSVSLEGQIKELKGLLLLYLCIGSFCI